jgi:hypothetical protein
MALHFCDNTLFPQSSSRYYPSLYREHGETLQRHNVRPASNVNATGNISRETISEFKKLCNLLMSNDSDRQIPFLDASIDPLNHISHLHNQPNTVPLSRRPLSNKTKTILQSPPKKSKQILSMSTPPPSTTTPFSDTPLHHSLNQLALSHNPLDDLLAEDLSLEDSFELTTSSSSPSVPVVVSPRTSRRIVLQRKEEEERGDEVSNPTVVVVEERVYSYTGTMGVLPPSPPSLTAPIHSRPTPSYPSSRPTYDDEEGEGGGGEEEVFEIDEEDEGLAEEDQRRRRTLREERDDLRIMNGYLEEIVKGLEMAESKMLVSYLSLSLSIFSFPSVSLLLEERDGLKSWV